MDQFLARMPKSVIAFLAIAGGTLFFILSDPPLSLCDVQVDHFHELQVGFLKDRKLENTTFKADFREKVERCKQGNSPGGCYSLFSSLRKMLEDVQTLDEKCYPNLDSSAPFRWVLWQSVTLMVQIAWGDKPPQSFQQKMGWLDAADMGLFCRLRETAIAVYGRERWKGFVEQQFTSLPGAQELSRQEAWGRMILSLNCQQF